MSDRRSSDVLGALPHSRPHRRSQKRPAKPAEAGLEPTVPAAAGGQMETAEQPAAPAARPKRSTATSKPSTTRAKRTPSTPRRPAGAAKRSAPDSRSARADAGKSARLRQPAQPGGTPRANRAPQPEAGGRHDILGTAVQAAAELAEIGLTVGARALRSAVSRLPRP